MMRALILTCCLMAAPAFAEDAVPTIAQDYQAGASVQFEGPVVTDLFMAGNRVVVAAPVAGSAHPAGRRVAVEAFDLIAAGYGVTVGPAVAGKASVTAF